jgi:hypothetical protein
MPSPRIALSSNPPLRVGFDLDGVILYNPIRIFRPLVTGFKHHVLHKTKTKFFVPQSTFDRTLFRLLHKTSFIVAPGLNDIKALVDAHLITAYLITGRFSFLKPDLDIWLRRLHARDIFTDCIYNQSDLQPHLYKASQLDGLKLDIFVEDNWDIVKYLAAKHHHGELKTRTFWIYNLFDRRLNYPDKFPMLLPAVSAIRHLAQNRS